MPFYKTLLQTKPFMPFSTSIDKGGGKEDGASYVIICILSSKCKVHGSTQEHLFSQNTPFGSLNCTRLSHLLNELNLVQVTQHSEQRETMKGIYSLSSTTTTIKKPQLLRKPSLSSFQGQNYSEKRPPCIKPPPYVKHCTWHCM